MKALAVARVVLLWALCLALAAAAQVAVPPLTARVTDTTSTLAPEQILTLERTLRNFEEKKGSQIGVLIVPSTAPETIEQYSLRVVEQWKLGRTKVDDGALLIVAKDDRTMRIEVGYGLEGVLNDAVSRRIISEVITPKFKQGDFYGGITDGVSRMMRVIEGEPLPAPAPTAASRPADIGTNLPIVIILALIVGSLLRPLLGRFPGAVASGGIVAFVMWIFAGVLSVAVFAGFFALLFTLFGGSMHGLAGRHHGGRFGGGFPGGGGGFGGRGGRFGGGGASGRW